MNLQDAIKQGKAQRVAVSILDAGGQLHEKYVISVKVTSSAVAGFHSSHTHKGSEAITRT